MGIYVCYTSNNNTERKGYPPTCTSYLLYFVYVFSICDFRKLTCVIAAKVRALFRYLSSVKNSNFTSCRFRASFFLLQRQNDLRLSLFLEIKESIASVIRVIFGALLSLKICRKDMFYIPLYISCMQFFSMHVFSLFPLACTRQNSDVLGVVAGCANLPGSRFLAFLHFANIL